MKDKFIEIIKGVVVNDKGDTIGKVFCPEFTGKIVDALISAGAILPPCEVVHEIDYEALISQEGVHTMDRKTKKRAEFIGFSVHDCETFYRCPYCGKSFGGWDIFRQQKNENGTNEYCPHCKEELEGLS